MPVSAKKRQNLDQLPLDKSLYDVIADVRPLWTRGAIQNHLGCFGFSGDEVFRSTRTLSGGERARLALALIVLFALLQRKYIRGSCIYHAIGKVIFGGGRKCLLQFLPCRRPVGKIG